MNHYAPFLLDQKIPPDEACPSCDGSGRHPLCMGMTAVTYTPCFLCYGTGLKSEAVKHQLRQSK